MFERGSSYRFLQPRESFIGKERVQADRTRYADFELLGELGLKLSEERIGIRPGVFVIRPKQRRCLARRSDNMVVQISQSRQ